MKHEAPNQFHAIPERKARAMTAAALAKNLQDRLQPAEQARMDALRHDDDPYAIAGHFCEQVDMARIAEFAKVRTDVLAVVAQNNDAAGALVITTHPEDVAEVIDETKTALDRIEVERERDANTTIGGWQRAKTVYEGWCDRTGARARNHPFSTWARTSLVLATAGLAELWATAQLLDGQAIEGAPSPYTLGFLFASTSLAWGVIGGSGTSLGADKRPARRTTGLLIAAVGICLWGATAILAAHLRGCIEDGGTGTVTEIVSSLQRGLLRPFASPMALILVAASALATAVAWLKWLDHIGTPFGHRGKDKERRWAEEQLRQAEEAHREAIRSMVAGRIATLDGLSEQAWRPANDGHRLEREVGIALVEARECFKAVERITRTIVITYVATFRRLRPGIDVTEATRLEPLELEKLGDPSAIHDRVEVLSEAASHVGNAVASAKADVRRLEVFHIRKIEERYGMTRGTPRPSGTRAHGLFVNHSGKDPS